ncbi:hypothetical protein [Hymenobacter sp. GOD-10R]|uniref:hypothetical protein n=1 Tax=Hymenobacter sp. GOD-10R TaxID=3093922 RepID=UPI002D76D26A|nr:hypothetical protein [Hymenobacter sp. GOD-10R]WRQ31657.1 hypothetical protein SD425_27885 [Hymenobacter sp. GOD-10R]
MRFLRRYTGPHVYVTQSDQSLLLHLLGDIRDTTAEELLLMTTTMVGLTAFVPRTSVT